MKARDYLEQAFTLDQRINSKIQQVSSLNELATKCTSTITGMPRSSSHGRSKMADVIDKIVDLQEEINRDIDCLVDLKREIMKVIDLIEAPEYRTVLEMRYLCFTTWEQIAVDLGYSMHHVYKVHQLALKEAEKWIPNDTI